MIALTRLASLVIKKRRKIRYSLPLLRISFEQPTLGSQWTSLKQPESIPKPHSRIAGERMSQLGLRKTMPQTGISPEAGSPGSRSWQFWFFSASLLRVQAAAFSPRPHVAFPE